MVDTKAMDVVGVICVAIAGIFTIREFELPQKDESSHPDR